MILDCDKVVSITDNGERVGIYEVGNSSEAIAESHPYMAKKFVELWNRFKDFVSDDKKYKSFMVKSVCREDLTDFLTKEQIDKLDDADMDYIAEKMSDGMQDCYWDVLGAVIDEIILPDLEKKETEKKD